MDIARATATLKWLGIFTVLPSIDYGSSIPCATISERLAVRFADQGLRVNHQATAHDQDQHEYLLASERTLSFVLRALTINVLPPLGGPDFVVHDRGDGTQQELGH
jgi:hypothetical protein